MSSSSARQRIVYVSLWPWSGLFQRPQHLALQLSKHFDVVYVCALPFHSRRSLGGHLAQRSRPRVHCPAPGLTVAEFALLPSGSSERLRELHHRTWAEKVAGYVAREHGKADVLWLSSPDQRPFLDRIQSKVVCYDCMDDYPAFFPHLAAAEQTILQRADVTFASATLLVERTKKISRRVCLVPNGVDVEHFRRALTERLPVPADMESIRAPRIGYYGSIADWFDYDAVAPLARDESVSIVLIGPVHSAEARSLQQQHANVHLLGTRGYETLPDYLAHFDVSILPFRLTELTRAVDPVKVYEYLAGGSDVVATRLPMLERHSHLLRLADTGDFAQTVAAALARPLTADERLARADAMRNHSWEHRADDIRSVLLEYL